MSRLLTDELGKTASNWTTILPTPPRLQRWRIHEGDALVNDLQTRKTSNANTTDKSPISVTTNQFQLTAKSRSEIRPDQRQVTRTIQVVISQWNSSRQPFTLYPPMASRSYWRHTSIRWRRSRDHSLSSSFAGAWISSSPTSADVAISLLIAQHILSTELVWTGLAAEYAMLSFISRITIAVNVPSNQCEIITQIVLAI